MAQTRTRQKGEEDFFAGLEKGYAIKKQHQDIQMKKRQLQFDVFQEMAKLQSDSEKLKVDMLKSGMNPGSQNNQRVGSFDPFTGKQVPGGVLYDSQAGTAVHRKPQKDAAQKTLSPRDLADLRYAMDDPALAPFLFTVLEQRQVPKEVIDQFKSAMGANKTQQDVPAGGSTKKQGYSPAQANPQGRVHLQEWVVSLGKISKAAPFERVAQTIITDPNLTSEEKQRLLLFSRKRFRPSGGQ